MILTKIRQREKQRKQPWKGDRQERETHERKIRYWHPLLLFRERWEKEHCVYFPSVNTYRASGMCEMNLWLEHLNKHIPPSADGLATMMISSQGCVLIAGLSCEPTLQQSNINAHQYTFFKVRELTGATGFYIKHTSRKTSWQKPYNNVLHLEICCSHSFVCRMQSLIRTSWAEQCQADASSCK